MPRIAFIGAGNIARSLIGGLTAHGLPAADLRVSDPDGAQLARLAERHPGLATFASNPAAAADCDFAVLCVKPDAVRAVCGEMAGALARRGGVLLSVAAGVPLARLDEWSGAQLAIIRCMPNTPVAVGRGVVALCAGARVSAAQRDAAGQLLGGVAVTVWLDDESGMDLVTALSGSGPAYFFRIVEAFEQAAAELGLPADAARRLARGTFCGAAALADGGDGDVARLRQQVTSPGGTTESGLAALEEGGINRLARTVLAAAAKRSAELAAATAR
ncbi:MAG: pyrroline-5-carboxylate reductase [Gammaproteobacteria bacterium]|nr:pyrroline-5-carboxylate reductase [Gammaproteobacteria bacterium]